METTHGTPRQARTKKSVEPPTKLVNLFSSSFDHYIDSHPDYDPRDVKPGGYGFLGNPFTQGTHQENLDAYKDYFLKRVTTDRLFYRSVVALYGKKLGCLGDPSLSHGQIILKWLHNQKVAYEKVFGPFQSKRF